MVQAVALISKGLRPEVSALPSALTAVQAVALISKGLRLVPRIRVITAFRPSSCPDIKGIKTIRIILCIPVFSVQAVALISKGLRQPGHSGRPQCLRPSSCPDIKGIKTITLSQYLRFLSVQAVALISKGLRRFLFFRSVYKNQVQAVALISKGLRPLRLLALTFIKRPSSCPDIKGIKTLLAADWLLRSRCPSSCPDIKGIKTHPVDTHDSSLRSKQLP